MVLNSTLFSSPCVKHKGKHNIETAEKKYKGKVKYKSHFKRMDHQHTSTVKANETNGSIC